VAYEAELKTIRVRKPTVKQSLYKLNFNRISILGIEKGGAEKPPP
jgi:hypothetical protein